MRNLNFTFRDLTKEELHELSMLKEEWNIILKNYNQTSIEDLTPELIEELYPSLKKGTRWNKKRRRFAIMLLGVAIGYCLERDFDWKWIKSNNEDGEEIALKHPNKDSFAFVFSSVKKRIRKKEYGYFLGLYAMYKAQSE